MGWETTAAVQSGVITRQQLLEAGLGDPGVRRLVRRRDLVAVGRGVYVDHTGVPTWEQRAWAAVLSIGPAALDGASALRAAGMRTAGDEVLRLAVEAGRRVAAPEEVRVRRVRGLEPRVHWQARPPRMRVEEAVLQVASCASDDLRAVGVVTDAVRGRFTTASRLDEALARESWLRRRAVIGDVVTGLREGADSVLEHAYLRRVEAAHRLPRADRQVVLPGGRARHDVVHEHERVVVELDGRAYHSLAADRFRDLERDAEAAAAGYLTIRLGWGQVIGDPCTTARKLARVLRQRGWAGQPRRCRSAECGGFQSPRD